MWPLSLYQMMFMQPQPQRPATPGPFADRPQQPQQPQQPRWFDMISAKPQGGSPAQPPSDPYSAILNMTTNAGAQGPQQPQQGQPAAPAQPPNPAGIPDWMRMLGGMQGQQQVAPGQVVQQSQPAAYRSPQSGLNIAQMGLGMMQPRQPIHTGPYPWI